MPKAKRVATCYGYVNVLGDYKSKRKETTAQRVVGWNGQSTVLRSFIICGMDIWRYLLNISIVNHRVTTKQFKEVDYWSFIFLKIEVCVALTHLCTSVHPLITLLQRTFFCPFLQVTGEVRYSSTVHSRTGQSRWCQEKSSQEIK